MRGMRRLLFTAALVVLLLPVASWAQRSGMHGGSFGGHGGFASSGHGGFGSRGAVRASAPGHFAAPHTSARFQSTFRPPFHPPTADHREHFRSYPRFRTYGTYGYPYGYGYPYAYGGYYDPFYWNWYNSSSSYDSSRDDYAAQQAARQIDDLSQQVEDLREEREYSQSSPASVPRPPVRAEAKAENDMTTVLVFLDKRIQEVKNYAIANEMVVVLDDHKTKKIPLADVDLAATMKLNDERGVDFEVPSPAASE